VQPLEDRCLLSNVLTQFALPDAVSSVSALTAGPDGNLWFTETWARKIGRMTPAGNLKEFALPAGSSPIDIATGSDGSLWITDNDGLSIDRLTPDGVLTRFHLPAWQPWEGAPTRIAASHHGDLWFTEWNSGKLGRISVTGQFSQVDLGDFRPDNITVDAQDDVWLADAHLRRVGRLTAGGFSVVDVPGGTSPLDLVDSMTTSADGSLWFTDSPDGSNHVGRISPAGAVSYFQLAGGRTDWDITAAANGLIWFVEQTGVGVINPVTGILIEYNIGASPGGSPTFGSDGNLWFDGFASIQRLDLSALPASASGQFVVVINQTTFSVSFGAAAPVTAAIGCQDNFLLTTSVTPGGGNAIVGVRLCSATGLSLTVSGTALVVIETHQNPPASSPPGAVNGGAQNKPAPPIFYDPTIRIVWNSLTDHGTVLKQEYVITLGGISNGNLPRDSLSSIPSTPPHSVGRDAVQSSGSLSEPVLDPSWAVQREGPVLLAEILNSAESGGDKVRLSSAETSEDSPGRVTIWQEPTEAILTSVFRVITTSMEAPPHSFWFSAAKPGAKSAPDQQPGQRELIAVAEEILQSSPETETQAPARRSSVLGILLRFAITFVLCQSSLWMIALARWRPSRPTSRKTPW
jgi:streptogramin lyase